MHVVDGIILDDSSSTNTNGSCIGKKTWTIDPQLPPFPARMNRNINIRLKLSSLQYVQSVVFSLQSSKWCLSGIMDEITQKGTDCLCVAREEDKLADDFGIVPRTAVMEWLSPF